MQLVLPAFILVDVACYALELIVANDSRSTLSAHYLVKYDEDKVMVGAFTFGGRCYTNLSLPGAKSVAIWTVPGGVAAESVSKILKAYKDFDP